MDPTLGPQRREPTDDDRGWPRQRGIYAESVRVALDITSLVGAPTGVGVVTDHLWAGLAQRGEVELAPFLVSRRAGADILEGRAVQRLALPAEICHRLWAHPMAGRFKYPRLTGSDIVHGPNYVVPPGGGAAEIATVHDLTAWRYPELVSGAPTRFPALVAAAARRGAQFITPSHAVAHELHAELGIDDSRIHTIHNGFTPPSITAPSRPSPVGGRPYLLAIGTIEPRKDYPTLLRAFAAIRQTLPDLSLIIAGAPGWGMDAFDAALAETQLEGAVTHLGYISDETKAELLAGAAAFVYPSVYEGFGLPPLEAASVGVPVITTDVAAIVEVMADGAEIVPVGDTNAMADAITRVINDDARRRELIERGRQRAEAFSWEAMVDAHVALYRSIHSGR